jgi:hypothetical protein
MYSSERRHLAARPYTFTRPISRRAMIFHGRFTKEMRDGRRACKTPKRNQRIANRAAQRRRWSKGHNRISVKMVKHIPYGVTEPADADEVIGLKSAICQISDDCRKYEFPFPEPAIQVGCASTSDHNRVEVPSVWRSKKGTGGDEEDGDQHRRD